MLNLILFGPPGSGKGTQAEFIAESNNLLHISTGDLFRYELSNDTPLGQLAKSYMSKGELVPDEITIGMLHNKINANPEVGGYLLDGFPRTIAQAEALDKLMNEIGQGINGLLSLTVSDEILVDRLLLRGETSGRADDNDETIIRNRLEVYKRETSPVFDYYASQGKAINVDGVGEITEITARLEEAISSLT
jgi:adenylate kinase